MFKRLPLMFVGVALLLAGCSGDVDSPEQQIRRFVETGVAAAEARSSDDLLNLVHAGYIDQKGYNRQQLGGLLRAYFLRHKNIHLFSKIDRIEVIDDNQARVELYVAMAGNVIDDIDSLASIRAQIYRFELQLLRQDDWLLQQAKWSRASIVDLE